MQGTEDCRSASQGAPYFGFTSRMLYNSQGSTHDMNKSLPAAPSGMYQQNSGAIPGQTPQHQQQSMGGPSPTAAMVQGQQGMSHRGHMQSIANFQQQRNNPPQMASINRPPIGNIVQHNSQQGSQSYQSLHNVVMPSHAQGFQPLLFSQVPTAALFPQRTLPYPPIQQYHQMYAASPYSYNTAPAPNPTAYFQVPQHMQTCPPTVNNMPPPSQPTPHSKRDRKILAIINPETGKNVMEEFDNDSSRDSSRSASMHTSRENSRTGSSDPAVCSLFAAQVAAAAVATKTETQDLELKSVGDPQPIIIQSESLNILEVPDEPVTDQIPAAIICDQFVGKEESTLELENTSVPFSKTDRLDSNTISDSIQITSDSNEGISFAEPVVKESYNLINHDSCNSIKESPPQEEYPIPSQDKLEEPVVLPEISQIPDQVQHVEVTIVSDEDKVESESNANCIEETTNVEQVEEVLPVCPSPPTTEVHASGDKTIEDSLLAALKAEKASEGGKKGKGKKKKDLNRKGESKEGSEMDAFIGTADAEPLSVASVPSPPVPVVSVPEEIPHPTSPTSTTSIVNHEIPDTTPVSTEFNNVVEVESPEISKEITLPTEEEPEDAMEMDISPASEIAAEVSKPALKYNYKEDQWSPLNPEGKKHYDREFLLQMQSQPMSLKKPLNLPDLDVIKEKAQLYKLCDVNRAPVVPIQANRFDPFVPNFVRGPQRASPHGMNRRSQQGRDKPKKIISFSSSLTQTVKLHESTNAWKPQMTKPEADNEEEVKNQEVYKKVRGILNKLTPQKFDTLVKQVKDLEINTEERLKRVIDLVFEKAIDEPNFSVPYASMCKQLALLKVPLAEQKFVNFRKLLLTKCQKEFEQDNRDELKRIEKMKLIEDATDEKKKQLTDEFADEERKNRRRQLGNIRFIGELFKFGMLTEIIMHECVNKLLRQGDEDSLECLCRLLTTIGKELETRKEKMTQDDFNTKKTLMNTYMTEMQKVVDKRQTSSRVRFMLQDVIDLRKTMWKPRRNDDNPKTIDQIHKEAEREAHEQQQLLQNMPFSNKRPPDDRKRSSGRNTYEQDGWITNNKPTKVNTYCVDPSKLQFKPPQSDTIQLGPAKGFFNWGRGGSGTAKPTPDLEKTVLANRYSALSPDQQQMPAQQSYDDRRNSQRSAASSRESSRGRNNQLPPQSLRKTPSTSKERENAMETVSRFTRLGQPEQKPLEPKVPNVTSVNGKETAVTSLKGPELSEEEIEKKVRPLLDEFIFNDDLTEAVRCITELASPSTIHLVITAAINHVLERSSHARSALGKLLHKLVQSKLIGLEDYNKGLSSILELVDDYALDIPLIWEYLGDIMAPMMEGNDIPISFLEDTLRPFRPSLTAGKLVAATLHASLKLSKTTVKLGEMWRESGLLWSNFLPASDDIPQFINTHALEFTVCETIAQPPVTAEMPTAAEIQMKLDFYLKSDSQNNDQIFDWIESHIGLNTSKATFIRALVTAVFENVISGSVEKCELSTEKLKLRIPLLQHHVSHKEPAELQALYALQALILRLNQPKGILNQIFDTLYDEDIISEETFYRWETSNEPSEQEGKGVAVNSVSSFFTWLREADNESDAEDG